MQGALIRQEQANDDALGIAIVLATILVSALCYAFLLHAGTLIA